MFNNYIYDNNTSHDECCLNATFTIVQIEIFKIPKNWKKRKESGQSVGNEASPFLFPLSNIILD